MANLYIPALQKEYRKIDPCCFNARVRLLKILYAAMIVGLIVELEQGFLDFVIRRQCHRCNRKTFASLDFPQGYFFRKAQRAGHIHQLEKRESPDNLQLLAEAPQNYRALSRS